MSTPGSSPRAPHFNRCENCHSLQRFLPSTFSLRRHNETPFGLSGGHVAVPCGDCHKPSANFKPKPTALYHWQNLACTTCHADPHQGRFQKVMRQAGLNGKPLECEACHSAESWKEFSRLRPCQDRLSSERRPCGHEVRRLPQIAEFNTAALINANFKAAPSEMRGMPRGYSWHAICESWSDALRFVSRQHEMEAIAVRSRQANCFCSCRARIAMCAARLATN